MVEEGREREIGGRKESKMTAMLFTRVTNGSRYQLSLRRPSSFFCTPLLLFSHSSDFSATQTISHIREEKKKKKKDISIMGRREKRKTSSSPFLPSSPFLFIAQNK